MGYSCTAKASFVMDAISKIMMRETGEKSSNCLPDGFYERSNVEHEDGAITGTVWKTVRKLTDAERAAEAAARGISNPDWVGDPCTKRGGFKISADGKVVRFPGLSKAIKAEAEAKGAAEYSRIYE